MIVSDSSLYKVDIDWNTNQWLRITTFHRVNISSTDWVIETIRLSPETQTKLVEAILTRAREFPNTRLEERVAL